MYSKYNMKLKKKEDQGVDFGPSCMGYKLPMGGNTETEYGNQTEGKIIQRLSDLGILTIYS